MSRPLTNLIDKTTADAPTLTPSKNNLRREQFRKLGHAISGLKDYFTGEDCQFEIKSRAVQDSTVSSKLFGPQMKTQQFERTVKR